jgi:hypothetical protein
MKERMFPKSVAPSRQRKPPEIFAFGLIVGEGHGWIVEKAQRVIKAEDVAAYRAQSDSRRPLTANSAQQL